jgi:hypothetical protein
VEKQSKWKNRFLLRLEEKDWKITITAEENKAYVEKLKLKVGTGVRHLGRVLAGSAAA